jgi:hypothetical protein
MKIKFLLISAIVLILEVFLSSTNVCQAISSGGLGIYPNQSEWNPQNDSTKSWFIYNTNPGEIKKSKVDIKNESDQSLVLKIYPVDAVTTKDGSFAPISEDSGKKDVGSWVNLPVSELSLGPNETKTVNFTISIPKDADIGDHMGAIIVQNKNDSGEKEGTSMRVINRLGARIYLTVPGEKNEKLEIGNFNNNIENKKVIFQLTLINNGNVRILPKGKIEINDSLGRLVDSIELTQREIFPKNTIVLPIKWDKTLNGNFIALATVEYSNQKITKELVFANENSVLSTPHNNLLINEKSVLGVSHTNNFLIIGMVVGAISIFLFLIFFIKKCF